jgi:hypothetical protein
MTNNQDQANSARNTIIHRHMQRKFMRHLDKLEKHKLKGKPYRAAVEQLEKRLFGPKV